MLEPDSAERLRDCGLLAEEQGFEALWLPNILSARDPFLALSLLARESQRIRLGPVAVSPFELHPAKIANALFTLNEFARGRADIVIGGGGGALIAMGLKGDRRAVHPHMVRGVRECVEFLRRCSASSPVNFAGQLYRVHDYAPPGLTRPAPRIYVAANGPQMLRLAARVGDGVMLSDIAPPAIAGTLATISAELAAAGRSRVDFRISNVIALHVKADREAAYLEARRKLWVRGIWERARIEPYIGKDGADVIERKLPVLARAYAEGRDPSPEVPRELMDRLADALTLVGDFEAIPALLERLDAYRRAGVDEIALRLYDEPMLPVLRLRSVTKS